MVLFEKIFQRNDRIFIQFYFFILGISLYLCSVASYYLRTGTFKLSEDYLLGSILVVVVFFILALTKTTENRYI